MMVLGFSVKGFSWNGRILQYIDASFKWGLSQHCRTTEKTMHNRQLSLGSETRIQLRGLGRALPLPAPEERWLSPDQGAGGVCWGSRSPAFVLLSGEVAGPCCLLFSVVHLEFHFHSTGLQQCTLPVHVDTASASPDLKEHTHSLDNQGWI